MSLEDLSIPKKKAIVVIALLIIIGLKVYGFIETRPTVYLIVALAVVAIITDATPTAAKDTLT